MIYLTGDTHGQHDISKLLSNNDIKENDYLIILGDWGGLWSGDKRDEKIINWYNCQPYTTLWLDGNHENFDLIKEYPITKMFGGKVQKISDKVIHLMRGEAYEIDGNSIFVMGGASSIDRIYRTEGLSWWSDEIPSEEEFEHAEETLKAHNYTFDYILSHCCSNIKQTQLLLKNGVTMSSIKSDTLVEWFNDIEKVVNFKHWYFGHYHFDTDIDEKHTCLYNEIIELGKTLELYYECDYERDNYE